MEKSKKIIIFGNTQFSQLMYYYLKIDTDREVYCFAVDKEYLTADHFCDLPNITYENLIGLNPEEHEVLLTIGYRNMNGLRERKYDELKKKNFNFFSYISTKSIVQSQNLGEANIIMEGTIIQPFTSIGDNNIIWTNCNIAHHSTIGNNNYLSPSVSLSGNVIITNNCFLGNNCTVKNGIVVKEKTLIGAAAYISKDTVEFSVHVPSRSVLLNKLSTEIPLT